MGFLDKSATVKDSLGGQQNQALRAVRAKRDADEAGTFDPGSCYRFWLTILR